MIDTVIQGNCLDILKTMESESVDCIVTDPPYGLVSRNSGNSSKDNKGKGESKPKSGFMGKEWDKAVPPVEVWKECLRVLKPGAFAFVMSIPRQDCQAKMILNLQEAGFDISYSPIIWAYACVSDDTEILTLNGWTSIYSIQQREKILIYDTTTKQYSWEIPKSWSVYNIQDTMFRIKSGTTDQLVTRGHRCYIERKGRLSSKVAEELSAEENFPVLGSLFDLQESVFSAKGEYQDYNCMLQRMSQYPSQSSKNCMYMPNVRESFSSQRKRIGEIGRSGELLFQKLQRQGDYIQSFSNREAHTPNECSTKTEVERQDVRRQKLGLERRCNAQPHKGQLYWPEIRTVSERISTNGTPGWMGMPAEIGSCSTVRQAIVEYRSSTSCRQRHEKRFTREPNAVCIKPRSQKIRMGLPYNTTMATVTKEQYEGIVFCPTVLTGCFVARRNGKIFLTGNSGFPKAQSVSKLLDRRLGMEREVIAIDQSARCPNAVQAHKEGQSGDFGLQGEGSGVITKPATPESEALDDSYSNCSLKPAYEVILVCMKKPTAKHKRSDVYRILGEKYDYWYTQKTVITDRNIDKLVKKWDRAFEEGEVIERRLALNPELQDEVILNRETILWSKPYKDTNITSTVTHALDTGKGITFLDAGRIPYESDVDKETVEAKCNFTENSKTIGFGTDETVYGKGSTSLEQAKQCVKPQGRFAPNLLVSGNCLDIGKITKSGVTIQPVFESKNVQGFQPNPKAIPGVNQHKDSGDFSRYFDLDAWSDKNLPTLKTYPFCITSKPSPSEKSAGLDDLPDKQMYKRDNSGESLEIFGTTDGGRKPRKNIHPTCKSISLMSYLIAISSREDDIVLDPYLGSGTTACACVLMDRHYIGCELDPEYVDIAERRIAFHKKQKESEQPNLFNF